jgi:hypothetical protein
MDLVLAVWRLSLSSLYSLLSRAIPHVLNTHELHSLTTDSTVCLQTHSQSPSSELTNCLPRLDSSQSSQALLGSGSWRWMFLCFQSHVLTYWPPSHADLYLLASAVSSWAELINCHLSTPSQLTVTTRLDCRTNSSPQLAFLIKPQGGPTENTFSVDVCSVVSCVPL